MSDLGDTRNLTLVLEETASAGVRIVGLRIANYAVGFVASILISRGLGPDGRGLYVLPVAYLAIVMALAHVGLEHSNVYFAGQGVALRKLWGSSSAGAGLMGLAAWAVVAVLYVVLGRGVFGNLPAVWLVVTVGQVPLLLQSLYWTSLLQLDGRLRSAVRATLVGGAVHTVLVIGMFLSHSLTPFKVLVLLWATNGTTWLILFALSARAGLVQFRTRWRLLSRQIAFGLKAQLATVFIFLLLRVDQILVQRILGFRELGLYSLAVLLAELMWLLTDPFAAALLPHQVRAEAGDERRLGFATARLSMMIAVLSGVVAWVLAPYGIRMVYGGDFASAVWPFRLLLPGVVALAIQRPLNAVLLIEGRLGLAALANFSALGVNVALNFALVPWIGLAGASVASTVTYVALAITYVAATRRSGVAGWRDLVPRKTDLRRLLGGIRTRRAAHRRPGPLRVVLVIGTLERGGSEGQVALLASSLRQRGCDVTVLCLADEGPLADRLREAGVDVVAGGFHGLTPLLNPLPLLRMFRRLYAVLRERDPDVVHTFLYWGNMIGIVLGRLAGARVLVSSQRSLRSAMNPRWMLRPWEWLAVRWSDTVVCNSLAVRADAIEASGVPAQKIRVIYNGVVLPPDTSPTPSRNHLDILVVANLIAYKGHDVLLEAFRRVLDQVGTDRVRLRLAGKGPEDQRLRDEARRLQIERQVEFLGSVPDAGVELTRCSFTVLPSRSEGLPNAVLESLAAGRPVVACKVGGIPEILGDGGGVLVAPDNPEELAQAMISLVTNPDRTRRLGREGRGIAAARFSVDRMVEETNALYRELLAHKRWGGSFETASRTTDDLSPNG